MPATEQHSAARPGSPDQRQFVPSDRDSLDRSDPFPGHLPTSTHAPARLPLRLYVVLGECEHARYLVGRGGVSFLPLQARLAAAWYDRHAGPSFCGHGCTMTYRVVELVEPGARARAALDAALADQFRPYRIVGSELAPEIRGPFGPVLLGLPPAFRTLQRSMAEALVRELNRAWCTGRMAGVPSAAPLPLKIRGRLTPLAERLERMESEREALRNVTESVTHDLDLLLTVLGRLVKLEHDREARS